MMGVRVAYIPYGLEYSDSVWAGYKFSNNKFHAKPWRMYALSPQMKVEHRLQSAQGADHISVTGHPKFDLIYEGRTKGSIRLPDELLQRIADAK